MMDSSVQQDYLTISSDTGFIAQNISTVLPDVITMSNTTGSSYYTTGAGISGSSGTITISNGGTGYTIGAIGSSSTSSIGGAGTGYEWSQSFPVEWVNAFPDFDRIKEMCEQYPALKIAYEKFVTTYKLVKDHYDTPEDERPIP
jgi:hypothetical protein